MNALVIGDDVAAGAFMDALAPDTRIHAEDWPPYPRPHQMWSYGPVLDAFLAASASGRRLELRQREGHPVVIEVDIDQEHPEHVPEFLRMASGI